MSGRCCLSGAGLLPTIVVADDVWFDTILMHLGRYYGFGFPKMWLALIGPDLNPDPYEFLSRYSHLDKKKPHTRGTSSNYFRLRQVQVWREITGCACCSDLMGVIRLFLFSCDPNEFVLFLIKVLTKTKFFYTT